MHPLQDHLAAMLSWRFARQGRCTAAVLHRKLGMERGSRRAPGPDIEARRVENIGSLCRTPIASSCYFDLEVEGAGLSCIQGHPLKRLELAHWTCCSSIALMQIELGDLFDRARRRVVHLNIHPKGFIHLNRGGMQTKVGIRDLTIGQAKAEGIERRTLLFPIAFVAGARLM